MIQPITAAGMVFAVVAAVLPTGVAHCDDPIFSGPQVGEETTGFELMGVYDDKAGKNFDPIAEADGRPTLLIFVHKLTRPGFALTRGLAAYADQVSEEKGYVAVAWLSDDKAEAEAFLNRARKSLNLQVPLGISVDGGEGPGAYGLNRNVELTILVAKDNRVTANFPLVQPSPAEAVKIAAEYAKALGIDPPTKETLQRIAFPQRPMRSMNRRRPANRPDTQRPAANGQSEKASGRPAADNPDAS